MTDETYERVKRFAAEQGAPPLPPVPVSVDEALEIDEPVLLTKPPEIVVSPSDFDDLRRRAGAEVRTVSERMEFR
jgi:hypothetical protein